jgi:predicted nucleic acid-binding protein
MSDWVYADSCFFLAFFKEEVGRVDMVNDLFERAKNGEMKFAVSTLVLAETLNLQGKKSPIPKEQRELVRKLFLSDWIAGISVTRYIAERAQDMVWDHGFHPKDAIHVATALTHKVSTFFTYDKGLITKSRALTDIGTIEFSEPYIKQETLFDVRQESKSSIIH